MITNLKIKAAPVKGISMEQLYKTLEAGEPKLSCSISHAASRSADAKRQIVGSFLRRRIHKDERGRSGGPPKKETRFVDTRWIEG